MRHVYLTWCLAGVGVAVILLLALGVQGGTILAAGAVLLCPLMMVFGMGMFGRGVAHHGHHAGADSGADSEQTTESTKPRPRGRYE